MGTASPEDVFANFMDIVKGSGSLLGRSVVVIAPWILLSAYILKFGLVKRGYDAAKDRVQRLLYASITIPEDSTLHGKVLKWMLCEGLQSTPRNITVDERHGTLLTTRTNLSSDTHSGLDEASPKSPRMRSLLDDNDSPRTEVSDAPEDLTYVLPCLMDSGTYTFHFGGRRMIFERKIEKALPNNNGWDDRDSVRERSSIVLSCLSPFTGITPLCNFLAHIDSFTPPARPKWTTIFFPDARDRCCEDWTSGVVRSSRELDAVTLDPGVKEALVDEVRRYLHPNTQRYYAARGIPWRRGYLFYGPPGTGKSSFVTALAGHLDLDIYMMSLSSSQLDDDKLLSLFENLPTRCIVLLEDIDSAHVPRGDARSHSRHSKTKQSITLSGLLNASDGVSATEGRVLIMTSNAPEALDEALVRRGRVDRKIFFGPASKEVAARLFEHVFVKDDDELLEDEEPCERETISQQAEAFASSFPERVFTPAEVQGYLIDHRTDPQRAVEGAQVHFEGLLNARENDESVTSKSPSSWEPWVKEKGLSWDWGLGWDWAAPGAVQEDTASTEVDARSTESDSVSDPWTSGNTCSSDEGAAQNASTEATTAGTNGIKGAMPESGDLAGAEHSTGHYDWSNDPTENPNQASTPRFIGTKVGSADV